MGPAGPTGPQGPAGLSQYELRSVETLPFTAPAVGMIAAVNAPCSPGRTPLSGGYELINNAQQLSVVTSMPMVTSSLIGWRVLVRNNTGLQLTNVAIRVWVTCGVVAQ